MEMIDHLTRTYGLSPVDAYCLCSVAVDLKISGHVAADGDGVIVPVAGHREYAGAAIEIGRNGHAAILSKKLQIRRA